MAEQGKGVTIVEPSIRVVASVDEMARQAAGHIVKAAADAVVATGRFVIALSGGNTLQPLYRLLAGEFADALPWEKTHVLFADERCVPADHADSNFGMICKVLLDHVQIPYPNIHRMAGEEDPNVAADEYNQLLEQHYGRGADLVLLGLGADAHTASLFPHTAALEERTRLCAGNYIAKLNSWRLTMTAPYINRAFEVMILAAGREKAPAVQQALEGTATPVECPIRLISPDSGRLIWLMDVAAAGMDEAEPPGV